jgi:hypothetical protein
VFLFPNCSIPNVFLEEKSEATALFAGKFREERLPEVVEACRQEIDKWNLYEITHVDVIRTDEKHGQGKFCAPAA